MFAAQATLTNEEFNQAIRNDAKISQAVMSDEELQQIFDHVDASAAGSIDTKDFQKFLKTEAIEAKNPEVMVDTVFTSIHKYLKLHQFAPADVFSRWDLDGAPRASTCHSLVPARVTLSCPPRQCLPAQ